MGRVLGNKIIYKFLRTLTANIFLLVFVLSAYSQSITKNGCYIEYPGDNAIVLQSLKNQWKLKIEKGLLVAFSRDSRSALIKKDDSLLNYRLGSDSSIYIDLVDNVTIPKTGWIDWICYTPRNFSNRVVLLNTLSGDEYTFDSICGFTLNNAGTAIVLFKCFTPSTSSNISIDWFNLEDGHLRTIWEDSIVNNSIGSYCFDSEGYQFAFIVTEKRDDKEESKIWYYKFNNEKAELLVNGFISSEDGKFSISNDELKFNGEDRLSFKIQREIPEKASNDIVKIDVWSFTDAKLQSQQLKEVKFQIKEKYYSVVSIPTKMVTRIEFQNEKIIGDYDIIGKGNLQISPSHAIIMRMKSDVFSYYSKDEISSVYTLNEYNWNRATKSDIYLMSLEDGSRTLISKDVKPCGLEFPYYRFDASGRFVIYFDSKTNNYLSYEIYRKKRYLLTAKTKTKWTKGDFGGISSKSTQRVENAPVGIVAKFKGCRLNLIADRYKDLWLFSPANEFDPLNITKGYFKKNGVKDVEILERFSDSNIIVFSGMSEMFQRFYVKYIKNNDEPIELKPDSVSYKLFDISDNYTFVGSMENSQMPPRYCYYDQSLNTHLLPNELPDRVSINKSLITWRLSDGQKLNGVLYLPKDFDSSKKYPLIISYYDEVTHKFNVFEDQSAPVTFKLLNISKFLSEHYIVLLTDIRFKIGKTGMSAYSSVVTAAKHLSKFKFVNGKKIGLIGHSFGGFETNYIISKTDMFSAACSSSGMTDLISVYGTEESDEQGYSYSSALETGQMRLGAFPWEALDIYIENSPIYYAHKVTTPLLLMSNKKDYRIPWSQGVEMFKALRRLGKPCWLLQYDDGSHGPGIATSDWHERVLQFFDYYLKDVAPPVWMTKGIPARMKGIVDGMSLDFENTVQKNGLLSPDDKRKIDALKNRKQVIKIK